MREAGWYVSLAQTPAHNLKRFFIVDCFSAHMVTLSDTSHTHTHIDYTHTLKTHKWLQPSQKLDNEHKNTQSFCHWNTHAAPAPASCSCMGDPVALTQLWVISSSQATDRFSISSSFLSVHFLPCRCLQCSGMFWRRWRWYLVGCCRLPDCLHLHLPPWTHTNTHTHVLTQLISEDCHVAADSAEGTVARWLARWPHCSADVGSVTGVLVAHCEY